MANITANIQVPPRSRTFTRDEARDVLKLLRGESEGQDKPAETVGFGEFKTAGAARSAGVTLNRLLRSLGAEHNYAVTTFQRDGRIIGVLRNRPAKQRTTASDNGSTKSQPAAHRRRRS